MMKLMYYIHMKTGISFEDLERLSREGFYKLLEYVKDG